MKRRSAQEAGKNRTGNGDVPHVPGVEQPDSARADSASARRMRLLLGADAAWDTLLGVALCLAVVPAIARAVGASAARPWPVFVIVGVGCLVFAVVLALGARGRDTVAICGAASLGNAAGAVAAVVAIVVLIPVTGLAAAWVAGLCVAAGGCALFFVLEWRAAHAVQ